MCFCNTFISFLQDLFASVSPVAYVDILPGAKKVLFIFDIFCTFDHCFIEFRGMLGFVHSRE